MLLCLIHVSSNVLKGSERDMRELKMIQGVGGHHCSKSGSSCKRSCTDGHRPSYINEDMMCQILLEDLGKRKMYVKFFHAVSHMRKRSTVATCKGFIQACQTSSSFLIYIITNCEAKYHYHYHYYYLLQLGFHPVAVVFTLVHTIQMDI
jgi:hypothetical protein